MVCFVRSLGGATQDILNQCSTLTVLKPGCCSTNVECEPCYYSAIAPLLGSPGCKGSVQLRCLLLDLRQGNTNLHLTRIDSACTEAVQ